MPKKGLIFLPDKGKKELVNIYRDAISSAVELYIVSAYLTDWSTSTPLSAKCRKFRFIIGSDFGITKKKACQDVRDWLPKRMHNKFVVADDISGFHPKAMFWRDGYGRLHGLIGSSNLSRAAFSKNFEANIYFEPSRQAFEGFKKWMQTIKPTKRVTEKWLSGYVEVQRPPNAGKPRATPQSAALDQLDKFYLPRVKDAAKLVAERQRQLAIHARRRRGLRKLFKDRLGKRITDSAFYRQLPMHWGPDENGELGNRIQGGGWQILGKGGGFLSISHSILRIFEASDSTRDEVVAQEIDKLARLRVPSRSAFLTEMLCLEFPRHYPIIDGPVKAYLSDIGYRKPTGISEGAKYIDIARHMRAALAADTQHPARTLADLDLVIWKAYPRKEK